MGEGHDEVALIRAEAELSVTEGGCAFCGVTQEQFAINGQTQQWPRGSHLKWFAGFDDLGGISAADARNAMAVALREIVECCGLTFEDVASQHNANLIINLARMDGPSGVLADCGVPMGNVSTDRTQLPMRLDTGEKWILSATPTGNVIDFQRVFLHEALHFCGLGHKPNSIREPALISPMYSPAIRNLQPADKAELVRRYGTPKPVVVPPGPPGGARVVYGTHVIEIDGVKWQAAGSYKRLP